MVQAVVLCVCWPLPVVCSRLLSKFVDQVEVGMLAVGQCVPALRLAEGRLVLPSLLLLL